MAEVAVTERWWSSTTGPLGPDAQERTMLSPGPSLSDDVAMEFLVLHRIGERTMQAVASKPALTGSDIQAATVLVSNSVSVSKSVSRDAGSSEKRVWEALVRKGVPPETAARRTGMVHGVPVSYLSRYIEAASRPGVTDVSLVSKADAAVLEHARRIASTTWTETDHPRDSEGKFTSTADQVKQAKQEKLDQLTRLSTLARAGQPVRAPAKTSAAPTYTAVPSTMTSTPLAAATLVGTVTVSTPRSVSATDAAAKEFQLAPDQRLDTGSYDIQLLRDDVPGSLTYAVTYDGAEKMNQGFASGASSWPNHGWMEQNSDGMWLSHRSEWTSGIQDEAEGIRHNVFSEMLDTLLWSREDFGQEPYGTFDADELGRVLGYPVEFKTTKQGLTVAAGAISLEQISIDLNKKLGLSPEARRSWLPVANLFGEGHPGLMELDHSDDVPTLTRVVIHNPVAVPTETSTTAPGWSPRRVSSFHGTRNYAVSVVAPYKLLSRQEEYVSVLDLPWLNNEEMQTLQEAGLFAVRLVSYHGRVDEETRRRFVDEGFSKALATLDWVETEHPRDSRGRFADKIDTPPAHAVGVREAAETYVSPMEEAKQAKLDRLARLSMLARSARPQVVTVTPTTAAPVLTSVSQTNTSVLPLLTTKQSMALAAIQAAPQTKTLADVTTTERASAILKVAGAFDTWHEPPEIIADFREGRDVEALVMPHEEYADFVTAADDLATDVTDADKADTVSYGEAQEILNLGINAVEVKAHGYPRGWFVATASGEYVHPTRDTPTRDLSKLVNTQLAQRFDEMFGSMADRPVGEDIQQVTDEYQNIVRHALGSALGISPDEVPDHDIHEVIDRFEHPPWSVKYGRGGSFREADKPYYVVQTGEQRLIWSGDVVSRLANVVAVIWDEELQDYDMDDDLQVVVVKQETTTDKFLDPDELDSDIVAVNVPMTVYRVKPARDVGEDLS